MINIKDEDIARARESSIVDYLSKRGVQFEKRGSKLFCNSLFSYDKTPSLCIYENTNTFYDWANGFGGDIIKLVQETEDMSFADAVIHILGGEFEVFDSSKVEIFTPKEVDIEKFLKVTDDEELKIRNYGLSRGIFRNYEPSVFIIKDEDSYVRRPSMGYIHVDHEMNPCGIKMRDIKPYKERRFSARGSQRFYILSNTDDEKEGRLYIVESESSANSLFEYFCIIKKPCVVVSFGSWSNVPKELPDSISKNERRSVIIDYDGNEDLYNERIAKFDHLNAREIKLELPKGEDLNSLFVSGKIHNYKNHF